jgi:hypothetical protein
MRKSNIKRIIAVYGVFCSGNLYALEYDYVYGYQILHSDNIRKSSANEESDDINRLYAGFVLNSVDPLIVSNTKAYARYENYINKTYADNYSGSLDSLNIITISPKALRWSIDDHLHYVPIDISLAATPTNSQQTNLFSTGPVVTLNISSVDQLELEGRYNKYQEEITSADNQSNYYAARINHYFTINSSFELNYELRKYSYDDPITYSNYTRHDTFVKYISKGSINDMYAELGNTKYTRDDNTGGDGIRSRFGLLRRMTPDSTLAFNYRNELSNIPEEQSRRSGVDTIIINGVTVSSTADIFRVHGGELIYSNTTGFGLVNARLWHDEVLYENVLANEKATGLSIKYNINTSAATNKIILTANYFNQKFVYLSRSDDNYIISAAYDYFYTRNIVMDLAIERIKMDSNFPSSSFDENRISAGFRYQTHGLTF